MHLGLEKGRQLIICVTTDLYILVVLAVPWWIFHPLILQGFALNPNTKDRQHQENN